MDAGDVCSAGRPAGHAACCGAERCWSDDKSGDNSDDKPDGEFDIVRDKEARHGEERREKDASHETCADGANAAHPAGFCRFG